MIPLEPVGMGTSHDAWVSTIAVGMTTQKSLPMPSENGSTRVAGPVG